MTTLSAIKFATPEGADEALLTLEQLQAQELIQVLDAAVVTWPAERTHPRTRQANDLVGAGALGGMFWGMLFGLLFLMPLIGVAVGAGLGALTGHLLGHVGIDHRFIEEVKGQVTPGNSALFALTANAVLDRVAEAFRPLGGEIISTNLSKEDEDALREAFTPPASVHP